MYFKVTVTGDANRYPTWALYGDNHEMVAWAGEGFESQANATRAANAFKSGGSAARYETFQDVGGSWRWRAWRSSVNGHRELPVGGHEDCPQVANKNCPVADTNLPMRVCPPPSIRL
ncbi:DUF1508 domain-containing protein, partial [Mycolicibacterium holsaticum]|uniref:DUF1508 domain-containing protein n=1 Tax=Mycolicibacterium holsaticum TaxID=152142 RepID=UPI000B1BAE23